MTTILDQDYIAFPGLGIEYLNPNRVAFTIFGQQVYWYGVLISLGFVLALIYGLKTAKRHGVKADDLIDMVIVAVPVCIICARAFYVLNKLDNYHSFQDVIDIRSGGLAIYGAVIGAILVVLIMSRIKKINPGAILDVASLGFLLAQAIGRWGNFINREAYGTVTSMPWGMEIFDPGAGARVSVHPCILYQSLWNIIGFFLLHFYAKKKKFSGEIFLLYMAWYGIGRAIIEGLRTDSLYIGASGIRISQLLGVLFFIISVVLIFILRAKAKRGPVETEYQPIYQDITTGEAEAEAEKEGKTSEDKESSPEIDTKDKAGPDTKKRPDAEDTPDTEKADQPDTEDKEVSAAGAAGVEDSAENAAAHEPQAESTVDGPVKKEAAKRADTAAKDLADQEQESGAAPKDVRQACPDEKSAGKEDTDVSPAPSADQEQAARRQEEE